MVEKQYARSNKNIIQEDVTMSWISFVNALGILKAPLGIKLYLNIIPILIGAYTIIKNKRWAISSFHLLYLMLFINGLMLTFNKDLYSIARLGQVVCLSGFSLSLVKWNKKELKNFFLYTLLISTIAFLIEIVWYGPVGEPKHFFGFLVSRYNGPVGESNYSAILIAGIGLLSLYKKYWYFFAWALVLLFYTASRTGALVLSVGLLLYIIFLIIDIKYKRMFNRTFLIALLLSPFIIILFNKYANIDYKITVENISNGRYFLFIPYLDMGLDNIFGVGYFNGRLLYPTYLEPIKSLVDSIRGHQMNEQHNIFIQVFSEFGVIGYMIFILFLFKVYIDLSKKCDEEFIMLFFVLLFGYSFLNGLNDMIIYFFIGLGLKGMNKYDVQKAIK